MKTCSRGFGEFFSRFSFKTLFVGSIVAVYLLAGGLSLEASTYTVTTTNDSGAGSLRQAISEVGTNNVTAINFNIAPGGTQTITPTTALPSIVNGVVIDGTTQPGFAGTPIIELNGSVCGGVGLQLAIQNATSGTIRGLVINRFGTGIAIGGVNTGGGHVIAGNYIGTDLSGTQARGNSQCGIDDEAPGGGSRIGGTNSTDRNVISGNGIGIIILGLSTNFTPRGGEVRGNFIGTDATGLTALANTNDGVRIGGFILGALISGNVISGNSGPGVNTYTIYNGNALLAAPGTFIRDNFIGTDASGTVALGNGGGGLVLRGSTTGGSTPIAIGGHTVSGNKIAFNSIAGVIVESLYGHLISSNSIYSNIGLGIDIQPLDVNPNLPGDGSIYMPNNGQNYPDLSSAINAGGSSIVIRGNLHGGTNKVYTLEFFASPDLDPSDYGEGKNFLGSAQLTTDGSGNALINLSFPTNVAAGQFVTATARDAVYNTSEFSLGVQVASGPALPGLTITPAVSLTEGNSGTTDANFTVALSSSSAQTVTVDYAAVNGTATVGSDFQTTSGRLIFTPGQTNKTISVSVAGDIANETNETFSVLLSNPTNAIITFNQGAGTGTISNDDPVPTLSVADVSVAEGNGMPINNADFIVSLSAPSGYSVEVNYATSDGSALGGMGGDYYATAGTLTFAPGETNKTVSATIQGDVVEESDEVFYLTLSAETNATIARAVASATIVDDDTASLSISDASIVEGNGGTTNAVFTVTLTPVYGSAVTVNYATADGTATAGTDYQAGNGVLTFDSGITTRVISIPVSGDTLIEPDETFFVNLSSASHGIIQDAQGIGTILNDDFAASLSIQPAAGSKMVLSWSTNSAGYSVQVVSGALGLTNNWQPLGTTPVVVNGQYTVTNSATLAAKFYRLVK